jgi:hypothetical protein
VTRDLSVCSSKKSRLPKPKPARPSTKLVRRLACTPGAAVAAFLSRSARNDAKMRPFRITAPHSEGEQAIEEGALPYQSLPQILSGRLLAV